MSRAACEKKLNIYRPAGAWLNRRVPSAPSLELGLPFHSTADDSHHHRSPFSKNRKTMEGSQKRKQTASWLDLPDSLTELILERLPLPDYLRFAAVCPKWQSIQSEHRRRHSPGPPPIPHPVPWLIPSELTQKPRLSCCSPLEQKTHRLPLTAAAARGARCFASCRGWLLIFHLDDDGKALFFLLNPLTGAQILLPPLVRPKDLCCCNGALSAPPTDPDCTVLLFDCTTVLLYRMSGSGHGHGEWTAIGKFEESALSVVYCEGKFYCKPAGYMLYVIDPHVAAPTLQSFEMDRSPEPVAPYVVLVEFDGEVLLVESLEKEEDFDTPTAAMEDLMIFRADLSGKKWVRVDSLGDRALFLEDGSSLSLLAADVGCKKNCVYSSKFGLDSFAWWVFDMETKKWMDGKLSTGDDEHDDSCPGHWFLPTLDYYVPPAENG